MRNKTMIGAAVVAAELGSIVPPSPSTAPASDARANIATTQAPSSNQNRATTNRAPSGSSFLLSLPSGGMPDFLTNPGMNPADWGQTRACKRMVRRSHLRNLGIGRRRG